MSQQKTDLGDSTDDRVGVIWGKESGDTNIVVAYSQLDRSPIGGENLTDYSQLAISSLGNSFLSLAPNNTVASGPYAGTYGAFESIPDSNCVATKGILVPAAPSGTRCFFYYGDRFNLVNDEDHTSMYSSVKTTLANGVNFELDIMQTDISVNDNPQSPSYPALSYLGRPVMPGKAGSPFSAPILWLGRALGSAFPSPNAPREYENSRVSLGLNGTLSNGFDWDVHYTVSEQDTYTFQPDTSTSRFDAAVNGTGGASGTESWNLFDPSANSAALIAYISSGEERNLFADLSVMDVLFTGTTKNNVDIATGFQWKKEGFEITRNDESKAVFDADGNIVQQSDLIFLGGGLENKDSRDSKAMFVEASKDMSDKLQLKGALRFENLESDQTWNPKFSMRYAMSDDVILRGSYSTSFREASISQLSSSLVALEGLQDFNVDGTRNGGTAFVRVAVANNPSLVPETSDNMNFGAIWTPNDQTSITVDYWDIAYENIITKESAQGKIIANPADPDIKRLSGNLVGVTTSYINAAKVDASGLDIEATYSFDTEFGQASVGINTARMLNYEIPNGTGGMRDVVGLFNHDNFARSMPETKSVITAKLNNGDHTFAAFIRMVSEYETTRALTAAATAAGFGADIDSFTTVDVRYSYDLDMGGNDIKISAGINNVADEMAPLVYDAANFSYDPKHHDPRGRMVYLGIKVSK